MEGNKKIKILDCVITFNGDLLNGDDGRTLIKGHLDKDMIFDDLGNEYPGGINKSGELVINPNFMTDNGKNLLNKSGKLIKLPNYISSGNYKYWTTDIEYFELLPSVPTGWVNVKIDMEIHKKIRRYSEGLNNENNSHKAFLSNLKSLNLKNLSISNKSDIQKNMAIIMILRYLKEMKDHFDPTGTGFLFESFCSGLIPNSFIKDDNGPVDVIAGNLRYQMKLYDYTGKPLPIKTLNGELYDGSQDDLLDYYIIGLKYPNMINIYVISGKSGTDISFDKFLTPSLSISFPKLMKLYPLNKRFDLLLDGLDNRIEKISLDLKKSLELFYEELSLFQYNVETILTGVDQRGKRRDDLDEIHDDAKLNIQNMNNYLNDLVKNIR